MKRTETIKKTSETGIGFPSWRRVNRTLILIGALSALGFTSVGQSFGRMLQQKDLAFPQVAAAPTIETVICVTNRGRNDYRGSVQFWKGSGQDWNPVVNGTRVSSSELAITIGAEETRVLRITSDSALEVGAVVIVADDLAQDNFVEGNLIYSIEGHSYDSVGIAPAIEFYSSAIPFEDFSSVGLALANANHENTVDVTLRLIDDKGEEQETVSRVLPMRSHEARFLSEIFSADVTTGKIEIESSAPLLSSAVTLMRGEISALPMLPSPMQYDFRFRYQGKTNKAEGVLWAEGAFVKGYLRYLEINGNTSLSPTTYSITGTLTNGVLRLTHFGAGPEFGGIETINSLRLKGFSFNKRYFTGIFTRTFPWMFNPLGQKIGTYELIRRD